ncbi:MAG: dihydrodipicolinate reductase C-terminal domain-containing protein [Vicinamibacterales bacterium]
MKILLIGHGRMGRLVESLAPEYDGRVVAIVTSRSGPDAIARAAADEQPDVAIDFSLPAAVPGTVSALAKAGISAVIGVTGWQALELELRDVAARGGIAVLAASNFSLGMHVFRRVVEDAARRFAGMDDVGAWIHETHHAKKIDAPSGTAVTLRQAMVDAGYPRTIDVSSTRAGSVPGTHAVGFDGAAETVTLTHTVRDRAVFARGALQGARWLIGQPAGWYGMDDLLKA